MEFCMEWNEICRVCLQEGTMQSIFDADEKNLTHSDKIMICANVKIERGVNLPEQICVKCLENLNAAYNFRNTCKKSDNMLQSFMQGNVSDLIVTSTKGDIVSYKPPDGLKVKRMKTVVKLEPKEEPEIEEDLDDLVAEDYYEDILGDNQIESNSIVPEEHHTVSSNDGEMFEIKLQFDNEPAEVKSNKLLREIDNEVKKKRAYNRRSDTERKTSIKHEPRVPGEKSALKICEICGNIYKHKHAFETHMRRHRNEKPFSCEICGRAFVLNVELRCHMRRHTGDKPYACRFCDRKFSDFGSRIKHERSHTGERPYPCTTCGKAFAYSYGLSSHMLTHTGEKPFNCELCRKRFTKKHHLKAHLHTHKRRGDYVDIETMLAAQPKPTREYQPNSEEENAVVALEMVT